MMSNRLTLAVESGDVVVSDDARIVVFGATAEHDLSAFAKANLVLVQGFYPDHVALQARGFAVSHQADGTFDAAIVFLSRARGESRSHILQAVRLTDGGPVIVDGQKTDGVDSMLKDCKKHGAQVGPVFSKAHGKTFTISGGDFEDWADLLDTQVVDGFETRAGVFSADAIDKGSALLAQALPADLGGAVGDLGAGWGYLSCEILKRDTVKSCHLVEASFAALDCARKNVQDPRAIFHWADARDFNGVSNLHHVVTNPPFHTGRNADPGLGRAFIQTAARILSPKGTLWLVANRHLPYESTVADAFIEVEEIAGDPSFKIIKASKPRRPKR